VGLIGLSLVAAMASIACAWIENARSLLGDPIDENPEETSHIGRNLVCIPARNLDRR
jgi:hypothetical protein